MGFLTRKGFPVRSGFAIRKGFPIRNGFAIDAAAGGGANPLQEVIDYMQSIGGVICVPDPANLRTDSSGTGSPAIEGEFIGWIKDLAGTRNLTQPTTASKMKLIKVPTKLGAELVVNGDFSAGTAGWSVFGSVSQSVSGGQLVMTVGAVKTAGTQRVVDNLTAGKKYLVSYTVVSKPTDTSTKLMVGGTDIILASQALGDRTATFVATMPSPAIAVVGINGAASAVDVVIDNVSLREVLEESFALEADGVNDWMSTVSLPAVAGETMIVAGRFSRLDASHQRIMGKTAPFQGLSIRLNSGISQAGFGNGGTTNYLNFRAVETGAASIYSARGGYQYLNARLDGVSTGQSAETLIAPSAALTFGAADAGAAPASCIIHAIAYAPIVIPDDKMLMIEKAFASLQGGTI